MQKREIGIFSGSFNPIHNGHLMLASYLSEFTYLDEVWFVVTPHNPLKDTTILLDDDVRLEMVKIALADYEKLLVSDIEFNMPRPSFTINTLNKLSEENPGINFSLIMGADNWTMIDRWRNYKEIIEKYKILIYPRYGVELVIPDKYRQSVQSMDAPVIEISSTFIRNCKRNGKNIRAFVPKSVYDYIEEKQLYL